MFVKPLKNVFETILKIGSIASLTGMVSVVMLQVIARLFFPKVPTWTEEVSRLMLLYTVGFSAGLAVKEKAYVNVDILTSRFPANVNAVLGILIDLVLAVFFGAVTREAWSIVVAVEGQTSAALLMPMSVFYFSMFLASLTLTVYLIGAVAGAIRTFGARKEAGEEAVKP